MILIEDGCLYASVYAIWCVRACVRVHALYEYASTSATRAHIEESEMMRGNDHSRTCESV